jgi:hypothetical protein
MKRRHYHTALSAFSISPPTDISANHTALSTQNIYFGFWNKVVGAKMH